MTKHVSISLRLTTWFGGIFLVGWLLFGILMWANLKATLKNERHQTLTRRAERLEELLSKNPDKPEADRYQEFKDFAHATGNGLSEIFLTDGTRVYPSPSSAAAAFAWPKPRPYAAESFQHIQSGGQPYWVLTRPFSLAGRQVLLFVAAPEAGNLTILQSFWRGLLASAPLMILFSSLCGYWVSRRALQPVDEITAMARSISIRNLSERVPITEAKDELQRLAVTCNAMLDRIESSVNQIKQFTADASHELRGPLAFTRTVAEVALKNPHIDSESRSALEDIVTETAKAAILLEEMLLLARADADPHGIAMEPVDLGAVLKEVFATARLLSGGRQLTLSLNSISDPKVGVMGDTSSLRRLLWILLDNALKYTDPHGHIDVSLRRLSEGVTILVRDDGVGISENDLPYIFNRFYRADPSRALVEGNGLGLAIAKWIAEIHSAELKAGSNGSKGTTFSLTFPIAY